MEIISAVAEREKVKAKPKWRIVLILGTESHPIQTSFQVQ